MDEINRVARLMIDAEPAADLDARIRARLDEVPATSSRRAWSTWQVAAGLAASLALAAVWSWGPEVQRSGGLASPKPEAKAGPEVQGSRGPGVQRPRLAEAGGEGGSPLVTLPPLRHSTGGRRAQVQVTRTLSAEELAWMERRIPALDLVVALQMDRLAVDSIQPEPLTITPLIMTTLPTSSAEVEQQINR